ncbi:MAG: apolipoprotein N-acyltransferase [Bernardetiaceae bacterium]
MNALPRLSSAVLSLLGAILLVLGWYPPFGFLLGVALVPLLVLSDRYQELGIWRFWGWVFLMFLGWNVGAIWWLWNASGWLTLGAWLANPFLQSLPVVVYLLTWRLSSGRFRFLPLVSAWLAFEWIHQFWELTFPWLNLGNALGAYPWAAQWYAWTGALGGSLWILVANVLAYRVWVEQRLGVGALLAWVFLPLVVSLGMFWSFVGTGEAVEVVVVQPNLDCYEEKFAMNPQTGDPATRYVPYEAQVQRLMDLAQEQLTPQTQLVAFPETALHKNIDERALFDPRNPEFGLLQRWLRQHPQLMLITGIDSYHVYQGDEARSITTRRTPAGIEYDKYNTALMLLSDSTHDFYRKSKLVIGAETTPFKAALPTALKDISGSLGTQPTRTVFAHPQTQVGVAPVICFESVYGEFVSTYTGTDLLLVITNDGWWGDTPGHVQHLRFSQLRAIEWRRPLARSANTGISCFIDPRGVITASLPYGTMGALRGTVQIGDGKLTFYAQHGDYLGRLGAFLAVAFLLSAYIRKLRKV